MLTKLPSRCSCSHIECSANLVRGVHAAILNAVPTWSLCTGLLQDIISLYMDLVAGKHQVRTWIEISVRAVGCP